MWKSVSSIAYRPVLLIGGYQLVDREGAGNHQNAALGNYVISGGSAHEQIKKTTKFRARCLGCEGRFMNDVVKLG